MKTLRQILLESQTSDAAHKLGLKSAGFGNWMDSSGKVTHRTDGGQLVKVDHSSSTAPAASAAPTSPKPKKEPKKKKEPVEKKEKGEKKNPYLDVPEKDLKVMMDAKDRGIRVPPAWREVWLNPEKHGDLQVKGKDAKGRTQYLYSVNFRTQQDAQKFERLKSFTAEYPTIVNKIESDMKKSEEAKVLYLISKTGFRIGGEGDTGADKKAFGASTLTDEHIKIEGDTVYFDFVGKKGVKQKHSVTDPKLAQMLQGKKGRLFDTKPAAIHEYLDSISKQHYKVKDFRTYVGTNTALQSVQKIKKPKDAKQYKKAVKEVSTIVGKQLGNTPIMAFNSYIDPTVFKWWKEGIDFDAPPKKKRKKRRKNTKKTPSSPAMDAILEFVDSNLNQDEYEEENDYEEDRDLMVAFVQCNHYQKPNQNNLKD